jgi:hypothetical protein
MEKLTIAFDIDGTLRCNCTPTCHDVNPSVVALAQLMSKMKNTTLIARSGGGAGYAHRFVNQHEELRALFGDRCHSKFYDGAENMPDIAIDDQHDFSLGKVNLIVRAK